MLIDDILELLATPSPAASKPFLERVDATLTDGYAHALALESERWRLEQRMSELAGELNEGNQELKSREMALLSDRLARNAGLLSGLRNELTRLRARTSAARRAR